MKLPKYFKYGNCSERFVVVLLTVQKSILPTYKNKRNTYETNYVLSLKVF